MRRAEDGASAAPDQMHATAQRGVQGYDGAPPFRGAIQARFGRTSGATKKENETVAASEKRVAPGGDAEAAMRPDGLVMKSFGTWLQSGLSMVDGGKPFLDAPLTVDGIVGPETRGAVRKFQQASSDLVPGAPRLPSTGFADAVTIWAIEQGTGSKNPTGRKAAPPEPTKEAEGEPVAGDTKKEAPIEAKVEGGEAKADGGAAVKQEIAKTVAKKKTRADAAKAYAELKQWTNDEYDNAANKTTARAKENLGAEYDRTYAKTPPDERPAKDDAWLKPRFFKAYWSLACDQFAHQLMVRINGPGYPNLNAMRAATDKLAAAPENQGKDVSIAGRDLSMRGQTLTDTVEKLSLEDAEPGIGIHMKARHDVDRPYDPKVSDEFHHWFTYVGDGKVSDSFGAEQTGAAGDTFMKNWVTGKFHFRGRPGEVFDFSALHTPDYADAASLAEYEALVADAKKEVSNASELPANDRAEKAAKKKSMASATAALAKAEVQAARKKLPKPKADFVPKVTAMYRPVVAKQAKDSK